MIVPSVIIPKTDRVEILTKMKNVIKTGTFENSKLNKGIFLAMIGKWGTKHLINFNGIESSNPGDVNGIVTVHRHIEDSLYRFGSEKEIVNNTNMYPFHIQCLHFEHMQLSKLFMLLNRIPYTPPFKFNVRRYQRINPNSFKQRLGKYKSNERQITIHGCKVDCF